MRKTLILILATVLIVAALGGCEIDISPSAQTTPDDTAAPEPGGMEMAPEVTEMVPTAIPGIADIRAEDVICIWRRDDGAAPEQPSRTWADAVSISAQIDTLAAIRLTERIADYEPHDGGWTAYSVLLFDGRTIALAIDGDVLMAGQDAYAYENFVPETDTRQIWMQMEMSSFAQGVAKIGYDVYNTTEDTAAVAFVPQLECATAGGWTPVDCEMGFCGTPDPLRPGVEHQMVHLAEWFPSAGIGTYRLSVTLYDGASEPVLLSDIFVIESEEKA